MSPRVLWALATAGFIEARRNRVTVIIAAFTVVLILMTAVVLNTTVFTLDRVVTDFGMGVMSLLMVGLAMFLSVGMLSREIEKRTIFLVVSRPVSRAEFVLGRYFGMGLTITALLAVMVTIYATQLWLFEVRPTGAIAAAVLGLWAELWVILALGLFFSAFAGQLVSLVAVVGLYLIGHWAPDLYRLGHDPGLSPYLRGMALSFYYTIPNLDRFDFKAEAAYGTPVEPGRVGSALGFAVAWVAVLVSGAAAVFRRRDFK